MLYLDPRGEFIFIMSTTSENNKRIAKNTLFLYFRQLLVMAVSLYTVRIVLTELGEEDYGIYNVVGGFVAMFNILSGALSVAIVRFLTYEMGLLYNGLNNVYGAFSIHDRCHVVRLKKKPRCFATPWFLLFYVHRSIG